MLLTRHTEDHREAIGGAISAARSSVVETVLMKACQCRAVTVQAYWEMSKKLLIVPYVPGSSDSAKPLLDFEQPILPLEERQTLLFFRATCLPLMYMYPNNTRITTGKVRVRPRPTMNLLLFS